jgi:hypothetical protein
MGICSWVLTTSILSLTWVCKENLTTSVVLMSSDTHVRCLICSLLLPPSVPVTLSLYIDSSQYRVEYLCHKWPWMCPTVDCYGISMSQVIMDVSHGWLLRNICVTSDHGCVPRLTVTVTVNRGTHPWSFVTQIFCNSQPWIILCSLYSMPVFRLSFADTCPRSVVPKSTYPVPINRCLARNCVNKGVHLLFI